MLLKKACKKYHALTAETLPQVDPIPQIWAFSFYNKKVLGILKWPFMYNENLERISMLKLEILKLNYVA